MTVVNGIPQNEVYVSSGTAYVGSAGELPKAIDNTLETLKKCSVFLENQTKAAGGSGDDIIQLNMAENTKKEIDKSIDLPQKPKE